jgi:uncharacterized membrane protein YkvA (DUF1232 family)
MAIKDKMKELKKKAKEIKKNIIVLNIAFKKKETPWYAKVMAGITIGYALSPIDLVPDFIPVLGYLDDIVILPLLILLTIKLIPYSIIEAAKLEAEEMRQDRSVKKWYYAVPIICIWVVAVILIGKVLLRL